jgi:hypothetical protein
MAMEPDKTEQVADIAVDQVINRRTCSFLKVYTAFILHFTFGEQGRAL